MLIKSVAFKIAGFFRFLLLINRCFLNRLFPHSVYAPPPILYSFNNINSAYDEDDGFL